MIQMKYETSGKKVTAKASAGKKVALKRLEFGRKGKDDAEEMTQVKSRRARAPRTPIPGVKKK